MTIEQLRNVHKAKPFRPFTIHMADGRWLHVPHSEFLSHSATGRTIIVHHPDETFSIVDLLLVNEFEVKPRYPRPSKAMATAEMALKRPSSFDRNDGFSLQPLIEKGCGIMYSWQIEGQSEGRERVNQAKRAKICDRLYRLEHLMKWSTSFRSCPLP